MRVDLNPARAAMCDTLVQSNHTTIQRWLREREGLINKVNPGRSINKAQRPPGQRIPPRRSRKVQVHRLGPKTPWRSREASVYTCKYAADVWVSAQLLC